MLVSQRIKKIKKIFKPEYKFAFISAFVVCIIAHGYVVLNTLPNHDWAGRLYDSQDMVTSGRWFLKYACGITSYFCLPFINGLFAFLYLGIVVMLLVKLFEITDKVCIFFVSGVVVAFPTITSTLSYMFAVDGYMLALLLVILSLVSLSMRIPLKKGGGVDIWRHLPNTFSWYLSGIYFRVGQFMY